MRSQLGIGLSCSPIPGQGKVVVEGEGIFLPLSGLSGRERGARCMAIFPIWSCSTMADRAEVTDSYNGKTRVVGVPIRGHGKMLVTVDGVPERAREQR